MCIKRKHHQADWNEAFSMSSLIMSQARWKVNDIRGSPIRCTGSVSLWKWVCVKSLVCAWRKRFKTAYTHVRRSDRLTNYASIPWFEVNGGLITWLLWVQNLVTAISMLFFHGREKLVRNFKGQAYQTLYKAIPSSLNLFC